MYSNRDIKRNANIFLIYSANIKNYNYICKDDLDYFFYFAYYNLYKDKFRIRWIKSF